MISYKELKKKMVSFRGKWSVRCFQGQWRNPDDAKSMVVLLDVKILEG
jgi:hypothetical protein